MRRAVFLDRDGTLGGDGAYCHPDAFRLFAAVPRAIRLLNEAGSAADDVLAAAHVVHEAWRS